MTQVNQPVAQPAVQTAANLQDCKWKGCKKTHMKPINYPDDGKLNKSSSDYSTSWVAANLEPWMKYGGGGLDSKPTLAEYRLETPNAQYAVGAAAMKYPVYHTQKHHLIPESLLAALNILKFNAKLVSYDINHKNNGVCLPTYALDIVRHDLQAHRGNHPNDTYYDKLRPQLKNLETACQLYCTLDLNCDMGPQKGLVTNLDAESSGAEQQIKAWNWLLRSDAHAERALSKARYATLPP